MEEQNNIIIYNSDDGRARVTLMTRDGNVWLNQNQMAELFATLKQNIGQLIGKILREKELGPKSTVKYYFTLASNGKQYNMLFYSLEMILAPPVGAWIETTKRKRRQSVAFRRLS